MIYRFELRRLLWGCALALCCLGNLQADPWHADDDTFDPSIQSVVIGNRSWIGDPSPFVHQPSGRTGYTYVNAANYEGMDPSVQISLMVPIEIGETKPVGGGMLMVNRKQYESLSKAFKSAIAAKATDKVEPQPLVTGIKDAKWILLADVKDAKRSVVLENKVGEETHRYHFSVNATKKLLGAMEHAKAQLKGKSE
ncbi:hypothetical protein LOC67_14175 [Stieleria sp. JC731]|uniref:hypothetical protein n=1 Tax=Pirellulaceae TaxID=2691357 RepID=UPI001E2EEAAE|nr:hypothetical protein [Stieleria sp. JC731]MCC9601702.1 hypothetical protein [Stieleria sp. JC731]